MNHIQEKRLLNVARSLRESADPKNFDMGLFVRSRVIGKDENGFCGTPACALGHYAARRDLQKLLKIKVTYDPIGIYREGVTTARVMYLGGRKNHMGSGNCMVIDEPIQEHFGIDDAENKELFDSTGCGNAKTPKAAARYIERFVARKLKAQAQAKSDGKLVKRDPLFSGCS